MDSAGHGIFELHTKPFPEVTAAGRLPTRPSSFNHYGFNPAGVVRIVRPLCTNLRTQDLLAAFPRRGTEP